MALIKLQHAWSFICPKCRKRNYVLGEQVNLSPEELEEAKEALNLPDGVEKELRMIPNKVVCKGCLEKYDVHFDFDEEPN